jgi:hypothetical protein
LFVEIQHGRRLFRNGRPSDQAIPPRDGAEAREKVQKKRVEKSNAGGRREVPVAAGIELQALQRGVMTG